MIYFDNAASSHYKPECVKNAVWNAMTHLSANPGRSGHSASLKAALLIHKTRERLKQFLDVPNGNIAFSLNCTQSLNYAILGTVKDGGHVITTAYEHNSVLRPLHELKKNGSISLTVLPPDHNGIVTADAIEQVITDRTYLVVTNHVSNVTGAVTPIKSIGSLCRKHGILYLVDAAQSAGHGSISMEEDNIDLCAFAPHKGIMAPQGVGVLAIGAAVQVLPTIFGGTGTVSQEPLQPNELPESLESGTLPTPAIAGLCAALSYAADHAYSHRVKLAALSDYAHNQLCQIPAVTIYTAPHSAGGIVSFNVRDYHSSAVADILSEQYDICVRGGLHCAPLIHKHLGTMQQGIVRASFGFDSTFAQVDCLIGAIKEIAAAPLIL